MLRQIQVSGSGGTSYRLSAGLRAARRLRVGTGEGVPFDVSRPAGAARIEAVGLAAPGN
ncbi:hypothetical protein [Streptomyces canus]|uniref:hypothetical protein n=1 Tax=Streptomyces canus TaxID=58343 RepID=UPI002E2EC873|nr:hypothetical protein [Streptomyces canus]